MEIKYLKYDSIDLSKWNSCISRSFNGIAYAYSWFLDAVADRWDALVGGDYEVVMPLTPGRKLGIDYILQPIFCQQLGVFSTVLLTPEITDLFIGEIPSHYKIVRINLNSFNKTDTKKIVKKTNITYELDLIGTYKQLSANYSTNTKRNIRQAAGGNISISETISPNSLLYLYRETVGRKLRLREEYYDRMRRIISFAIRNRIGSLYGAYTPQNTLCAAAFFLETHNKSIYIFSCSDREGFEKRAMFLIVDEYIRKNAEKSLTLDFEGSMIGGLARFYGGFGATPCQYLQIRRNTLPWPVNVLTGR
ncbi:MAG: hypothetical protein KJ607_07510 [Bacteroidetes bacterium]|nr:hypothetical protein [Bacteroidota bacterium]